NAGKSTLMRAITGADVLVADQLFATLDTRTRRWCIPNFGDVLLSDTVGFVRNLPHDLVASFRSTLEEARHADLLLHVVDAANPEAERQIHTVYQVLEEIGIKATEVLLILNKADRVEDPSVLDILRRHYDNTITISAATGDGIERLTRLVADRLAGGYVETILQAESGNGRFFAWMSQHGEELEREFSADGSRVQMRCRIPRAFLRRLPPDVAEVTKTLPRQDLSAAPELDTLRPSEAISADVE
ncbi:MAG: 50S ribosome-binding GTPase, partial [Planctomycetaceae bacterium]|nr:50S ribosome-binding GTPase [Planctomycetaceae bacterium]